MSTGKGHLFKENVILRCNFAKGTTVKAKDTTSFAVGVVGYFEDW